MEASEAEGDDGASVFERAAGAHEPALLEDPSGAAAAPPSAKEVFDNLVQEQCAKKNVNCWTQAQVDTCITCLDGWADLEGWQRMERAREGYGEFTSKPYGWVNGRNQDSQLQLRRTLKGRKLRHCWPVTQTRRVKRTWLGSSLSRSSTRR